MKKLISLFIAAVMMLTVCGCSSQDREIVVPDPSEAESGPVVDVADRYIWNVAMNVSESTLNYQFYSTFKKDIEARSKGKITVNLFPNGQLGGDAEQLLGLIDGTVDFSTTTTSSMTGTIREYGLFDLPNAFLNVEAMRNAENDPELLALLDEASGKKNLHLLGLADAGFRELTSNEEVRAMEDLKGIKIRVMDNPYHQAYWSSLGAATTTMDFNEVYSSLQQKVIDAEENPYMNICSNRFYEVQPYIVETNHLGHMMLFTMNNKLYNSLPEDVRTLVDECAAHALTKTRGAADEAIENYKQTIRDYGCEIIELDEQTLSAMQEKAEPVYSMVRNDLGDEPVEIFLKASGN